MREVIENRFVIEMIGNAYPFYVSDIHRDGNPCFTAETDRAVFYRSEARAYIDIEKIKSAGFTMKLKVEPIEISYKVGGNY